MSVGPAPEKIRQAKDLSAALRLYREDILTRWAALCRQSEKARHLTNDQLLDHLPQLLDRLAAAVEASSEGRDTTVRLKESRDHALHRLDAGFDLPEITNEYALLRQVLFAIMAEKTPHLVIGGFDVVGTAIDASLTESVDYYVQVRHRTLEALDQVAQVVTGPGDASTILRRILTVTMQTVPAVDGVTILLRRGKLLKVREALGVMALRDPDFSLAVGEGFAGTIAATGQPLFLSSAGSSDVVRSEFIRQRNIKAMYGVPMLRGAEVVGVAHMASLTAHDFAEEDKLLFRTVAERATGVVVQADLMDQLRSAVAFRERLLGIVSHDLRTPLASISLAVESMNRQEPASPAVGKAAEKVKRAVDRMGRMISDLLDFTRIQAHAGLPIMRTRVDLCAVVRETLDELEPAYPGRIQLRAAGDPLFGQWDGDRLAQVVSNLVTNALEHGEADTPVNVDLEDAGTVVRLIVTNLGETITPEDLPVLFDPFRRAAGETRGGGLGLGLHIVSEVARAHGGEVSVTSRQRTTTFTVTLPKTAPEPARAQEDSVGG